MLYMMIELENNNILENQNVNSAMFRATENWIKVNEDLEIEKVKNGLFQNRDKIKLLLKYNEYLIEYVYEDFTKKMFILDAATSLSNQTLERYINVLQDVEKMEIKFNKCVREFTIDQISNYIVEIFNNMQYHKVEQHMGTLVRYDSYYNKVISSDVQGAWNKVNTKFLLDTLTNASAQPALTKLDIRKIYNAHGNPQYALPMILAFEGVLLKQDEHLEEDEMRFLKDTDLNDGELTIRNKSGKVLRKISVDSNTSRMIKEAIAQDAMIAGEAKRSIIEIEDSEYMLKRALTNKKKDDDSVHYLSHKAVQVRIKAMRKIADYIIDDVTVNYRNVRKFGKFHYITTYIVEGFTLDESIELTLKRFGDWYYGNNESDAYNNIQAKRRLKKLYNVHQGQQ